MGARTRIGTLSNTKHRPGGGNVKIENRKLDWNTPARTKAVNEKYSPGGGDVKIENRKLDWNTESRVGSTKNLKHKAGGGNVQIHNEKLEFKVTSRIGSLANVKHKPGGGDKKIFDDKEYARQMNSEQSSIARSGPAGMAGSQAGSHPQSPEPPIHV